MDKTVEEVDSLCMTSYYRILLSHRPHHVAFYEQLPVNLIISGHAHGGQWAIPFLRQGLYAPQQGLFPRYTHGIKNLDGRLLYISRGFATGNKFFVRLYNNPELGFIDLLPINEKTMSDGSSFLVFLFRKNTLFQTRIFFVLDLVMPNVTTRYTAAE